MGKRVYVMMSLRKDLFVVACKQGKKLHLIPGYPWKVLESFESAMNKCRKLNRSTSEFVYFYMSLYLYPD